MSNRKMYAEEKEKMRIKNDNHRGHEPEKMMYLPGKKQGAFQSR